MRFLRSLLEMAISIVPTHLLSYRAGRSMTKNSYNNRLPRRSFHSLLTKTRYSFCSLSFQERARVRFLKFFHLLVPSCTWNFNALNVISTRPFVIPAHLMSSRTAKRDAGSLHLEIYKIAELVRPARRQAGMTR
jgi:hypothetical protein